MSCFGRPVPMELMAFTARLPTRILLGFRSSVLTYLHTVEAGDLEATLPLILHFDQWQELESATKGICLGCTICKSEFCQKMGQKIAGSM